VEKGRIPNAMLFAGPEAVGKKAFALALAAGFVCREPVAGGPCGECGACRRASVFDIPRPEKRDDFKQVFFSEHPDVGMVVPYNKNILVDAIRDLEKEANFRPFEGRARFFIVDDADKMNDAASNALLKTLEEPSPSTYIVLVSSHPDSLLQTILSRCQIVRFAPVDVKEIESHLLKSGRFGHDDAALAAKASAGSVGRALNFDVEAFRSARELMFGVLQKALERPDIAGLLQVSELISDAKNKDRFEEALDILESLVRDVWTAAKGLEAETFVNAELSAPIQRLAKSARAADLSSWLREIETLRNDLAVNINKRVATDALFVGMSA
jgi:DNA polymerase-3 subunit delta'